MFKIRPSKLAIITAKVGGEERRRSQLGNERRTFDVDFV
jgi:hypothetical protein